MNPGETLGHYRIEKRLGVGGMGEVYLAVDTKLNRPVALKTLRQEFFTDPERHRRFVQEAQAASALDHPNIVTIHDIAEHEGRHFIVMQYVAGESLGELIRAASAKASASQGLGLDKALDYAVQIADGLARAHRDGIVHRDLKPDNVMVSHEGRAKIVDFGLAKLTEPLSGDAASGESPTRDMRRPLTREGEILGTGAYMSPEQALGKDVDARSDIFSFGSVLYEMVTGKQAFSGENIVSVLASVMRDEPGRVSELVPAVSAGLESVIERALRKDREQRFQSMEELRDELVRVKDDVPRLEGVRVHPPLKKYGAWVGLVLVVAFAVVAIGVYLRPVDSPAPIPRTRPLTSFEGGEYDPALSRDGTKVAFVWDGGTPGGVVQLYVKLIDGTDVLQLTNGPASAVLPTWSPDGQQIAFLRVMNWAPRQEIFVISALGGQERRVGETSSKQPIRHKLSWSPDGKNLAIVDESATGLSESIYSLSLETGERQELTTPASGLFDSSPTFSPDGETIAFLRSDVPAMGGGADVYSISRTGGKEVRLTSGENVWGLDWTPDGREVIYSNIGSFGQSGLRSVTRDGGEPRGLAFGANAAFISIARNANVLAYMQPSLQINIWRVGGPAAERQAPPERLIGSTYWDFHPSYSPDGSRVAFTTGRSGGFEVWSCDGNGKDCGRVTKGWEAEWSPDGALLAFTSATETDEPAIFLIEAAGGFPRRLTQGPGVLPRWSRDGRFVYFSSKRTGRPEIWKVATEGGKAEQITQNGGINAFESEDGRFVYFAQHLWPPRGKIWKVPVGGGEETIVLNRKPHYLDWGLWDGNLVYVNPEGKKGPAIELFDLDTKETQEVVGLPGRRTMGGGLNDGLTISPDGRWVTYVQVDGASSDLMLVENFR